MMLLEREVLQIKFAACYVVFCLLWPLQLLVFFVYRKRHTQGHTAPEHQMLKFKMTSSHSFYNNNNNNNNAKFI